MGAGRHDVPAAGFRSAFRHGAAAGGGGAGAARRGPAAGRAGALGRHHAARHPGPVRERPALRRAARRAGGAGGPGQSRHSALRPGHPVVRPVQPLSRGLRRRARTGGRPAGLPADRRQLHPLVSARERRGFARADRAGRRAARAADRGIRARAAEPSASHRGAAPAGGGHPAQGHPEPPGRPGACRQALGRGRRGPDPRRPHPPALRLVAGAQLRPPAAQGLVRAGRHGGLFAGTGRRAEFGEPDPPDAARGPLGSRRLTGPAAGRWARGSALHGRTMGFQHRHRRLRAGRHPCARPDARPRPGGGNAWRLSRSKRWPGATRSGAMACRSSRGRFWCWRCCAGLRFGARAAGCTSMRTRMRRPLPPG
ncbi:hypothetical protein VARIO8X_60541 [Burkholderiales bacterium 8X]|nr:hypothetical protein VARIO8X_60541 [Burkholderiales bacterium 8X]